MSTTVFNGRQPPPQQRKQLSDQLDRFDQILDGLAEGLQGAIVDAAREGTRLAVKDAIREVLNDPALRAVLDKITQPIPAKPSFWMRLKARITRAKATVVEVATPMLQSVTCKVRAVTEPVVGLARALGAAWKWKKAVLVGIGVGLATTTVSLVATHGFAAVVAGVGGAITAVTIQFGVWLRRTAQKLRVV